MADESIQLDLAEGTLDYTPRPKFHFDALYTVFFNRRFEEVMHQLAGRDFKILVVMLRFCAFGNDIRVQRTELARLTNIAENHISSIIRKLERLGIMTVVERGSAYQLNERYFWRGNSEEYNERRRNRQQPMSQASHSPQGAQPSDEHLSPASQSEGGE